MRTLALKYGIKDTIFYRALRFHPPRAETLPRDIEYWRKNETRS
jgi:hypothetical protein